MDLAITKSSYGVGDLSALASAESLSHARTVTMATADLVEDVHYKNGILVNLQLIGVYTSGTSIGLWGPFTPDATDGRQTAKAILVGGQSVKLDAAGAPASANIVEAAMYRPEVHLAALPGTVLDDGTTAHVIVEANLPNGVIAVAA